MCCGGFVGALGAMTGKATGHHKGSVEDGEGRGKWKGRPGDREGIKSQKLSLHLLKESELYSRGLSVERGRKSG